MDLAGLRRRLCRLLLRPRVVVVVRRRPRRARRSQNEAKRQHA
jgi:hypothetical protein